MKQSTNKCKQTVVDPLLMTCDELNHKPPLLMGVYDEKVEMFDVVVPAERRVATYLCEGCLHHKATTSDLAPLSPCPCSCSCSTTLSPCPCSSPTCPCSCSCSVTPSPCPCPCSCTAMTSELLIYLCFTFSMMEEIKEDSVLDNAVDDKKTYPHSQKTVETTFKMEGIVQKEEEIKRGDDS